MKNSTINAFKKAAAIAQLLVVLAGALALPNLAFAQAAQTNTAPAQATNATQPVALPTLQQNGTIVYNETQFTPSDSDASLRLLKSMLGDWDNGQVHPMLGNAMFVFNGAVMVFAAAIFGYVVVTSVAMAAHDGSLVGKGRSSLWIPARLFIGAALIFPTATGLSLAQHGYLWLVKQGIGIASSTWSAGVEGYTANQGNMVALRLAEKQGIRNTMYQILQAETCVADLNNRFASGGDTFGQRYSTSDGKGGYMKWGYTGPKVMSGFSSNYCGQILATPVSAADRYSLGIANFFGINDSTPIAGAFKQVNAGYVVGGLVDVWKGVKEGNQKLQGVQLAALQKASETLRPMAENIATFTNSTEETEKLTPLQVAAAADAAAEEYINIVAKQGQALIAAQNEPLTKGLREDAKQNGWATAGSWFFQLGRINSELGETASWVPEVKASMPAAERAARQDGNAYVAAESIANSNLSPRIMDYLDGLIVGAEAIRGDPEMQGALIAAQKAKQVDKGGLHGSLNSVSNNFVGAAAQGAAYKFGYDPTSPVDPIIQMQNVGNTIIGTIEVGAAGALAAWGVSKLPAAKAVTAAGDLSPLGAAMKKILGGLEAGIQSPVFWIVLMLLLGLIVAAITLAFWLPMSAFIMWTGQVLGWIVSVFEMLVAVPIWIAAHLHPEGEGVAGQHAASGYKVLLEILARPALLIFGLIGAMLLMTPFMQFFGTLYFNALSTTTADSLFGIVSLVVTVLIYAVMCYMTINMVLHAIVQIPNGIMRVIGGMEGTNMRHGQEMERDIKAGVMAGVHKGVSAGKEGVAYGKKKDGKDGVLGRLNGEESSVSSAARPQRPPGTREL